MYKGRTMRKKDLIYFVSAALLLSVSAQVAKADELTSNEPVTADKNHPQATPSVETKTGDLLEEPRCHGWAGWSQSHC